MHIVHFKTVISLKKVDCCEIAFVYLYTSSLYCVLLDIFVADVSSVNLIQGGQSNILPS